MQYIRIKNLREDYDIKQIQLAEYLGCSQNTYSDYERGKINIPLDMLIKLADFYNVSLDYLTERTDNPNIYKRIVIKKD